MKPSTDVWSPWYFERICTRLREGEERGAVVTRERADAIGDLLEPQTGRSASTVCPAFAAACVGDSPSASTAAFTPMCSCSV